MKSRGGAVVELVVWMGVFTLALAVSFETSRALLWRLRLISAARLAAVLAGTDRVEPRVIERELNLYCQQWPDFRHGSLAFSLNRFFGVPSAPFYKLVSVALRLRLSTATLDETVRLQQEETT